MSRDYTFTVTVRFCGDEDPCEALDAIAALSGGFEFEMEEGLVRRRDGEKHEAYLLGVALRGDA